MIFVSVQVWLPAMKAKGLEISGTFVRRAGVIQMEMTLTNKAMSVMTDFAIQFNRNRYHHLLSNVLLIFLYIYIFCDTFSSCVPL